jgi:hypothetical protein
MRFHRLRIQVDDLPGRLAAVAANLAACGVNIVDIDVHSAGSRARVDELIVEFTVPLDLPAVEYAVTSARAAFLDIEAIDPHALCDRATSALDAAASAIGADPASAGVTAAAQALVEAEVAWDAPGDGLGADHPVVRQALDGRSPVHASEPVQRLPNGDRPTWWLALPYESPAGLRVLVLVRRTARFTFTETSRLQALLRVATAARGVVAGSTVDLADGGAVTVRALDPSDAGAVSGV